MVCCFEGRSRSRSNDEFHGTTILAVRKDGRVALGGDGQVSIGDTVMKSRSTKVRALKGGKVLAGFAGSVADALTLYEKFEEKLDRYPVEPAARGGRAGQGLAQRPRSSAGSRPCWSWPTSTTASS